MSRTSEFLLPPGVQARLSVQPGTTRRLWRLSDQPGAGQSLGSWPLEGDWQEGGLTEYPWPVGPFPVATRWRIASNGPAVTYVLSQPGYFAGVAAAEAGLRYSLPNETTEAESVWGGRDPASARPSAGGRARPGDLRRDRSTRSAGPAPGAPPARRAPTRSPSPSRFSSSGRGRSAPSAIGKPPVPRRPFRLVRRTRRAPRSRPGPSPRARRSRRRGSA